LLAPVCGSKAATFELDPVLFPLNPFPLTPPVAVLTELEVEDVVNPLTLPYFGGLRGWTPGANTFEVEGVIAGRNEDEDEAVDAVEGG
jgi:hypothetical protein